MLVFGEVGVRVKREEHKKYKEEKSDYKEYLKTEHWQEVRELKLQSVN
jgi:hypothetical protein